MPRSKDPRRGRKRDDAPRIAETPALYMTSAPVEPDAPEEGMALTKVTRHGQITLPSEVRRRMGIEEGDLIEVGIAQGKIMLTPKRLVDKSQAWFWTPGWQAAEAEAQADIDAGRVAAFASLNELIADLDD